MKAAAHAFFAIFLVFLFVAIAPAQTRSTGIVEGHVVDSSGALVPTAEVTVENATLGIQRQVRTDSTGKFFVNGLPLTGVYRVRIQAHGFEVAVVRELTLRADDATRLEIRLAPESARSTVNVFGGTEGVQTETAQLDQRLGEVDANALPVLGRRITNIPLVDSSVRSARGTGDLFLGNTLIVINGSGRRQTTYSLDNGSADDSWGRQTLFASMPLTALQEFTVISNAISAEYGRSTGAAVNIVSKSGGNLWHGDAISLWRPGSLQAPPPLAVGDPQDRLWQGSGMVSGPIVKDRTFFLLSAERNNDDRGSSITSALGPGLYEGKFRETMFLGRLDQIFDRHRVMLRANLDRFSDTNPSDVVGGLTLPSAARVFRKGTYSLQLSDVATISPSLLNEARIQWQDGSPITRFDPVAPSTQFVRPGVGTEGESRVAGLMNHQYQFADTLSWVRGAHELKFGTDIIYSSSGGYGQEFGGGFLLGQFRVKPSAGTKPLSQLTINDVSSFTQSFGNATYNVQEALSAFFVQDDWSLSHRLTLNLGLRYDLQTFTDDRRNFSPRLGFAYRLPGVSNTVLRGSYGVFYSEARANLAAGWKLGGPEGLFSFTATPGQFGFPTTLAALPAFPAGATLPARDITVRPGDWPYLSKFIDVSKLRFLPDGLHNPKNQQWTLGLERDLGRHWMARLDYLGQHTIRIDRPIDLNAPAPYVRTTGTPNRTAAAADATRPITPVPNGYKRVLTSASLGAAYYNGLHVSLERRFGSRFSLLANYTLSHTLGTVESDGNSQDPNDYNFFGRQELGNSILDQRHRFVVSGWYRFPWQITAGTWTSLASGRPYNITTGMDNNGDASTADRPVVNGVVLGRDAGRGTPTYDISTFIEKQIVVRERVRLSLRGEAFNLFNHQNIVGRNGVGATYGTLAPALGGMANVDPGRQFQFELHFGF